MDTNEIIDAVFDVKTNGELSEILRAVRDARKALALRSRSSWYVGQEVNVVERSGTTLGTIKKVNRTRCQVTFDNDHRTWNVPMSMLEVA